MIRWETLRRPGRARYRLTVRVLTEHRPTEADLLALQRLVGRRLETLGLTDDAEPVVYCEPVEPV